MTRLPLVGRDGGCEHLRPLAYRTGDEPSDDRRQK